MKYTSRYNQKYMKTRRLVLPLLMLVSCLCYGQDMEVFATFDKVRPANPAVDQYGNVYVTMHPMDAPTTNLYKIDKHGKKTIYPNMQWSGEPNELGQGIANAIGIQATTEDLLYILDWGNATSDPRIVVWDILKNKLHRLYIIPSYVRKSNSFLQDLAIDTKRQFAYIADMGRADLVGEQVPAIISIDLSTGLAKRILEGHDSFLPSESGFEVDGRKITLSTEKGELPVNLGLNPIAIDPDYEWVYYSTVNAGMVYRIKASLLADFSKTSELLAKSIESYGPKPASDGISVDGEGNVYVTSLSEDAIGITSKDAYKVLVKDKRLSWADGLSYGPDGYFYAVVNQLDKAAPLNRGKDLGKPPYLIVRFKAIGKNTIGR